MADYVGTCPLLLAARLPGRISAPTDADILRARCMGPSCAWWRAGRDCCAISDLARAFRALARGR